MKLHSYLAVAAAIALTTIATGCKSNITNLREQFSPTYHDVVVEADESAAYTAAVSALTQMGYSITDSGAARKKIEAVSAISPAGATRPARQLMASARIAVAPNNTTAIQILFTEIRENKLNGQESMGTKQPLSDSALYHVFADYVNASLKK